MNGLPNGRKIFISGKITGDRSYKAKFDRVAAELRDEGYIVLNPATLPMGLEYRDYARICMAMLEAADTILLLPDYTQSHGAKLEKQHAKYIGKEIAYYSGSDAFLAGCERPIYDNDDPDW